jgi:hypothetical protein
MQVLDSSGDVVTGTYAFVFNISSTSNCGTVVYTNSSTLTTDSRGIISYYLRNVSLDYNNQYWLCYYRNGVLINTSQIARVPYAFRARNVTLSGVEVDQNLNMGSYNITAPYFFGDGRYLTNLNVSAINLSSYVPYTGATQNVNLSSFNLTTTGTGFFGFLGSIANRISGLFVQNINASGNVGIAGNLTVDTSTLFVDSSANEVGIGTSNPQNALNVVGDINATGYVYSDRCLEEMAYIDKLGG